MLSPVKIYDGEGNLKKVISPEELNHRYWKGVRKDPNTNLHDIEPRSVECGVCGTVFTTKHKKAKYCDKMCAKSASESRRKGEPIKNESAPDTFRDTPDGKKRERRKENKSRGTVPWSEPYERRKTSVPKGPY